MSAESFPSLSPPCIRRGGKRTDVEEDLAKAQGEGAICESRREVSEGNRSGKTLISDFSLQNCEKINLCGEAPHPSLWDFVMIT